MASQKEIASKIVQLTFEVYYGYSLGKKGKNSIYTIVAQ